MSIRVVTGPATNIPAHEKSHVRGWALGWSELLNADVDNKCSDQIMQYDKVYLDHGVNFTGALNLFAGAGDEVFERFNRLMAVGHERIVSLDWEMPDYGEKLAARLNAASTSKKITAEWCESLSKMCKQIPYMNQSNIPSVEWLAWGDSHAPAYARMGSAIVKKDGRTMYGVLKNDTLNTIEVPDNIKGITLALGSIDVRHHLMREGSISVVDLMSNYIGAVRSFRDRVGVTIELCAPVPIEFEERKLPKSGYFKKTPFYGKRGARMQLDFMMMKAMKDSEFDCISPPKDRYMMDGEEYAKTYMELGGSVHMAPTHYRRYNEESWCTL
jgi:hypothetical protein